MEAIRERQPHETGLDFNCLLLWSGPGYFCAAAWNTTPSIQYISFPLIIILLLHLYTARLALFAVHVR